MTPIVRLFNPKGPHRVAVVSVQPVWGQAEAFTLQVVRGPRRTSLTVGRSHGPFSVTDLPARHAEVLAQLRTEGFLRGGVMACLTALRHPSPAVRARAALRLGWLGEVEAVPALLEAAGTATTELPSLVEALGMLGDSRAVPLCRAEASRKLLSRRRAGAEALRALGDTEGLALVRSLALDRLPQAVRALVETGADAKTLAVAVEAVDKPDRGLVIDTLYELATPETVAAAVQVLMAHPLGRPHVWRYARSVFKRAMVRHDAVTFGVLAHAVETEARAAKPPGVTAVLKSGLDGVARPTPVARRATGDYLRRRAWRYLRRLARYRPGVYAHAAAEAMAAYVPTDARPPRGLAWEWSDCYLLHRVLWGGSSRFRFVGRAMRFQLKNAKVARGADQAGARRDEAHPDLWDTTPTAYLRLLVKARLRPVQGFAVEAVTQRHPTVVHGLSLADLLTMLGSDAEAVTRVAVAELARRFDPDHPDWSLVDAVVLDTRPAVRALGVRWLADTAHLWTREVARSMKYLAAEDGEVRTLAADLVTAALDDGDAWYRREMAEGILALLQSPEATPGVHGGYARVARDGLARDLASMLTVAEVMAIVMGGSAHAQSVAGAVLALQPDAFTVLGMPRVTVLARHDVATVRAAACVLLHGQMAALRTDPSVLFTLCECPWDDTRNFAFGCLRDEIDLGAVGVDGLVGLCDANRGDAQDLGRELVLKYFDRLDPQELIVRLAQHPAPRIRRFAVDLAVGHLKDGFVALCRLEGFFRTALLDVRPERREKRAVVGFLLARGLRDERQAEVASRLLGEFVRTRTRTDFEAALEALVRIKLAWPGVESAVTVATEAGGAP